eukprot:CAMPEP_0168592278 /NCGR_PEP_ID=MMETSP0420-20121227/7637_1 /TAXON_ID=498008 /ORGANISM="Pessonella sp." /LENGTH=97 /DNA_ID=CAMNT_0008628235 /DNA_START=283 /DNA_END=572 /DNA_ORIENTATION=+
MLSKTKWAPPHLPDAGTKSQNSTSSSTSSTLNHNSIGSSHGSSMFSVPTNTHSPMHAGGVISRKQTDISGSARSLDALEALRESEEDKYRRRNGVQR